MQWGPGAMAGGAEGGAGGVRGGDAWNWQERDLKGYVDARVAELFPPGRRVPLPGAGAAGPGAARAFLLGPGEARGEAFGNVRRGSCFAIVSLDLSIPFRASVQAGPGEESFERAGTVVVGGVEASNAPEEWEVTVEVKRGGGSGGGGVGPEPGAAEGAAESRLKGLVEKQCRAPIALRVETLRAELQRLAGGASPESARGGAAGSAQMQEEEQRVAEMEQQAAAEERGREEERQRAIPQRYKDAVASLRGPGAAELEALSVSRCRLTDGELAELQELLPAAAGIRSLDLSHNRLTNGALQALVAALAGGAAPRLEQLDLRGNQLSPLAGTMLRGLQVLRKGLAVEWA